VALSDIDVAETQSALAAFKRSARLERTHPVAASASAEDAFRRGVASRRKAFDLLSGITAPSVPHLVRLDTPFLIWAFHNYDKATDMLQDTHVEAGNNSAQIFYDYANESGDVFFDEAELNFYFLWQNDAGGDAVVNVSSLLFAKGRVRAYAEDGWIPSFGLWGGGTEGSVEASARARLTLLEWWNQPPTEPLQQTSQVQEIAHVSADGNWALWAQNGDDEYFEVADTFHVNYDSFLVPQDEVAIFEVSLQIFFSGWDGFINADFSGPGLVLCPHVELEVRTSAGAATVGAVY
jgi:hypothetical protein